MKAIPYRLTLLEPVLVSQVETGDENSAIGLAYIPGSALRGALVARYLSAHPTEDMAALPEPRQWFLDGTVCFLNAYPVDGEIRMLPTPRSWFSEKDSAGDDYAIVRDWAIDPKQQMKQPRMPQGAPFCHLSVEVDPGGEEEEGDLPSPRETRVVFYEPRRQVDIHIALVNPNRRDDTNKVYRYDALAAGEVLAGAVVARDDFDLTDLHALLQGIPELLIGRGRTAGYGRVRLEVGSIATGWEEYTSVSSETDSVVVTLLSDTLVRGNDGHINGDLDGALAELLGLDALEAGRRYQQVALVGGFNCKWGLPLAQGWALQAGSVYVYRPGAFDPEALRHKAALGIGERRAEGLGRIAVNWHTTPTIKRQKLDRPVSLRPELSAASQQLAREMAQRRLRLQLDRGLTTYLSTARFNSLPPNAQLSRVRSAVQQALATKSTLPVRQHLEQLKTIPHSALCSVTPDLVGDLDNCKVPAGLLAELQRHHEALSLQAQVTVEDAGNKWTIVDGGKECLVRRENQALNVYYPLRLKRAGEQLKRAQVNGVPLLEWIKARVVLLDVEQQLLGGERLPNVAEQQAGLDEDLRRTYILRLIDGVMQVASRENQKEGK